MKTSFRNIVAWLGIGILAIMIIVGLDKFVLADRQVFIPANTTMTEDQKMKYYSDIFEQRGPLITQRLEQLVQHLQSKSVDMGSPAYQYVATFIPGTSPTTGVICLGIHRSSGTTLVYSTLTYNGQMVVEDAKPAPWGAVCHDPKLVPATALFKRILGIPA